MNDSKKPRTKFLNKIGSLAFRLGTIAFVRKDPLKAERIGQWFGRFAFRFAGKQRRRALLNLKLVFPDMSETDCRKLSIRCFEHFGMVATEFFRTPLRTRQEVALAIETVEGLEHCESALKNEKGFLLVLAHFGNWEFLGSWLIQNGFPLVAVQRDANDPAMNREVTRLRESAGMKLYSRGSAARSILAALKDSKCVAILSDQNSDDAYLPFLGHIAGTAIGAATIKIRTKVPLIPTYCIRTGPHKFRLVFEPSLVPDPGSENPVENLTLKVNQSIEAMVLKYPEQWLWFHDRWKNARRKGLIPDQ